MCLGIPGKLIETYLDGDLRMGRVDFDGIQKRVCLEYVPEIQIGDYALVHVGFAISRIDESEAKRVFELLRELEGPGVLQPGGSDAVPG